MTRKQQSILEEFISIVPENEKSVYIKIIEYLVELGYIPQKQSVHDFILSFKHETNKKVIAKMGIRKQKAFISIRFFACKNVPEKYIMALRNEYDLNEEKKKNKKNIKPGLSAPIPDHSPMPSNTIMKKCTLGLCSVCTGGNMRYYYQYPDGKEIFRCGAYPVLIPDITQKDIDDLKQVLLQQHNYFLFVT